MHFQNSSESIAMKFSLGEYFFILEYFILKKIVVTLTVLAIINSTIIN